MRVDTVVKNCKVVRPEGITTEGIAIDDGKIVALASDANLPKTGKTIDAKGNYVIPGVLDNHMHLGGYQPLDVDTRIDTAAAAYGGVTTIGNTIGAGLATTKVPYTEIFEEWKETIEKNAFTDFVINPIVNSEIQLKEIPIVTSRYGMALFKLNLGYKGQVAEELGREPADDGRVSLLLKAVAALGPPARAMFHCENIEIINKLVPKIKDEEGRQDLVAWADARPGWVEALDIERVVSIAKITNAPIYIVHLSSAQGVDAVAKAKAEGVDIIAETCPPYLTLTKYAQAGVLAKVNPPLRDEESIERLWEGIKLGIVECMGSDNASNKKESKQKDIWAAAIGYPGVETYLPILLSEGVNKGRITLEKLVEICCANNAKAMGIYPKKGSIQVGTDADLVIVDLNKRVKLSAETLHQVSDYTIYEGWEVRGYPVLTMLRGNVVVEDGKLRIQPGIGRYVPRHFPLSCGIKESFKGKTLC